MDDSIPLDSSQSKQCRICRQNYPLTFFNKSGHKWGSQYRNECKTCSSAKYKQWLQDHKEERKIYNAQWEEAHKEERQRYYTQHNQAHREEYRAHAIRHYHKHIEEKRIYRAEYRRSEHGKRVEKAYRRSERGQAVRKAISHKRRVANHYRRNSFTANQFQEQIKRQHQRCYYCQQRYTKKNFVWHADHVIPLSKGGSNDISNVVATCPTCNLKKANKLPHEFPEGGRLM